MQNKPLTISELKNMIEKPIYVVEITTGREYWGIIKRITKDNLFFTTAVDFNDCAAFTLCGKTWLAYRYEIKEEKK